MLPGNIKLAPSIISADFARLGEQVREAQKAGADYIHVDVLDGRFAPNLTIGPLVVESLRPVTRLPLDTHLMVLEPERLIPTFAQVGSDIMTVHAEACPHLHRVVSQIKELGKKACVGINPATPLSAIEEVLADLDMVTVMTVNPGFPGQKLIPATLDKVVRLRKLLRVRGLHAEIEVDGGINSETALAAVRAGADVLVAASAVFNKRESVTAAIARLVQCLVVGTGKAGAPRGKARRGRAAKEPKK